jgi:hypothetical protein
MSSECAADMLMKDGKTSEMSSGGEVGSKIPLPLNRPGWGGGKQVVPMISEMRISI